MCVPEDNLIALAVNDYDNIRSTLNPRPAREVREIPAEERKEKEQPESETK